MEHWKAKLAVNNDAPPEEEGAGGGDDDEEEEAVETQPAAEYEFLGSDSARKKGDSQVSRQSPPPSPPVLSPQRPSARRGSSKHIIDKPLGRGILSSVLGAET